MNHQGILQEIEHQITIAIGGLALVEATKESDFFLQQTKAELVGVALGIRNIRAHMNEEENIIHEAHA